MQFHCSSAVVLALVGSACGGSKPSTQTPSGGGTGGTTMPAAPTGSISAIGTGAYLSCSLDAGVASCWGELGDNTGSQQAPTPVAIDGIRFVALTAFGRTVCGVTDSGAGYCWGPNTDGQLGTGSADAGSKMPAKLKGNVVFASIAAGNPTSCGLTSDGIAYCWGENGYGEVGNGVASTADVLEPTAVSGNLTFTSISVQRGFTCGVAKDGAAYCWGSNTDGQLGTGKPISGQTTDLSKVPVKVVGGHTFKSITTGQFFACGLTTGGAAYCWGRGDYRLGDGSDKSSSTPVAVKGGNVFTQLDAGRDFVCGITPDHTALCWGSNSAGQLGNGPGTPSDLSRAPIPVTGGHTFVEISAADGEHTCAITLDRASVYCWGANAVGQLGNGSPTGSNTSRSPTPTKVLLPSP